MAGADLGVVWAAVKVVLRSSAAGFALGETVLTAAEPSLLTADAMLLATAVRAAGEVGMSGMGAVAACLAFATAVMSMGTGLLLGAWVMSRTVGNRGAWWWVPEMSAGVAIVVGATVTGTLAGVLPTWVVLPALSLAVLMAYPYPGANQTTAVLSVIFGSLYLSIISGRMGLISGLFVVGITISALCAILKALSERSTQKAKGDSSPCSERLLLYSTVVAMIGFPIGLGAGGGVEGGSGAEASLMLGSVVWVSVLAAALLGAALGTVSVVCLEPEGAGRVALGAAVTSSVTLRILLPACSVTGPGGSVGGLLGGAVAAGVSLGAAGVAAGPEFKTNERTLVVLVSVVVGALLGSRGLALGTIVLGTTELITIAIIAVGAFILGAPKSPFHTKVNLRGRVLTGPSLMGEIGMEAVTAAASPLGAGVLGMAALGTAALGRLGTVGALVAALVALGTTLCGAGEPPQRAERRE